MSQNTLNLVASVIAGITVGILFIKQSVDIDKIKDSLARKDRDLDNLTRIFRAYQKRGIESDVNKTIDMREHKRNIYILQDGIIRLYKTLN